MRPTVYVVWYDNGEPYEESWHDIECIFSTREAAEKWLDSLPLYTRNTVGSKKDAVWEIDPDAWTKADMEEFDEIDEFDEDYEGSTWIDPSFYRIREFVLDEVPEWDNNSNPTE